MRTTNIYTAAIFAMFIPMHLHAQKISTGANTQEITLPDKGKANIYPSTISISDGLQYIDKITVKFPSLAASGTLGGLDLLLESPAGTRMLLMSDLDNVSVFTNLVNFTFSSVSITPVPLKNINQSKAFKPTNYDITSDSFPAPGPGKVVQANPTFQSFVNENPNGVWKLYALDDLADNGTTFFFSGWQLTIESSATPACPKTELAELKAIADSSAALSWLANGPAPKWDVLFAQAPLAIPNAATTPTFPLVDTNYLALDNLPSRTNFEVYTRSACPNGSKSEWTGPLRFRTTFTPCRYAPEIGLCQITPLSAVPSFTGFNASYPNNPQGLDSLRTKWMTRFTAPHSGSYWVDVNGNSGLLYQADTAGQCPLSNWTLSLADPVTGNDYVTNFEAGKSYWLLFFGDPNPSYKVRVKPCPTRIITTTPDYSEIGPFSVPVRFQENGANLIGVYDFFYTPDPGFTPDNDTPPSVADIEFKSANGGKYTFNNLQPLTGYYLWMRGICLPGAQKECWYQVASFNTVKYCGDFDSVWFESITETSAELYFAAPTGDLTVNYKYGLKPDGSPPVYGSQTGADTAGQIVHIHMGGLLKDTTYYVFFRAFCLPNGGNQPWQGPFPVKTLEGCFIPAQNIVCQQTVSDKNFASALTSKFSGPAACTGGAYTNVNEYLYRIQAGTSGPMGIHFTGASGSTQSRVAWYYKDAALGCNAQGFQFLGCWDYALNDFPAFTFPADSGHTYLLLSDGYLGAPNSSAKFNFRVSGCLPPCQLAPKELHPTTVDKTGATVTWQDPTGNIAGWDISLHPDSTFLAENYNGLSYQINGLTPFRLYEIYVRGNCGPDKKGPWARTTFYTTVAGAAIKTGSLIACGPYFSRPNGQAGELYGYDFLEINPVETGYHWLRFSGNSPMGAALFLYENTFDPESPAENLLASSEAPAVAGNDFSTELYALLDASKSYFAVLSTRNAATADWFYIETEISVVGPATAGLSSFQHYGTAFDGYAPPAPTDGTVHQGEFQCIDANGWAHVYDPGPSDTTRADDRIVLSLQDFPGFGTPPYPYQGGAQGASVITNPPALYVSNPDGWVVMNRYWDWPNIWSEPPAPVKVRFYYTDEDFSQLQSAISAAGGNPPDEHKGLVFYKINNLTTGSDPNPANGHSGIETAGAFDKDGYWEYHNGPSATATTWRYGQYRGAHFAEMLVAHFSGGGGGIGVAGGGATPTGMPAGAYMAVHIFPVPATAKLTIATRCESCRILRYRLSNVSGQILRESREVAVSVQTVDLTGLPDGVFWLEVETDRGQVTRKVVKLNDE